MNEFKALVQEADLTKLKEYLVRHPFSELKDGPPTCETPMRCATKWGSEDVVGFLGDNYWAEFCQEDKDAALIYYATKGNINKVENCLDKGANIDAVDFSQTALHRTTQNQHVNLTKILTRRGGNVNASDRYGTTPFIWTLIRRNTELFNYFLEHAKPNLHAISRLEGTPLTYAIFSEQFDNAIKLIEQEGQNFKISDHPEALNWAIRKNRKDIVSCMLTHNADGINTPGGKTTDIDDLSIEVSQSEERAIKEDECNDLALIWAVGLGHEEIVDLLLKHGVNPETQNLNGISAKTISQDPNYAFPNIKAKLSGQGLKPLRSSREMKAIGIFKTEGPHSPEDTGRDKKESSPGREEKSIEMLLEERIKERAKQDAEFLARLEGLKAKVKEEKKLSSGSDEIPAVIAEAFQKAETIIKESTEQDEKKLETFKTSQSGQGNSPK